jgi:hypothetical protein
MARSYPTPTHEGHFWAQWRIARDGTRDGDELTPTTKWEVVQVNVNNNGGPGEEFTVSVPGVEMAQWRDDFVWGPEVPPLVG